MYFIYINVQTNNTKYRSETWKNNYKKKIEKCY